MRAALLVACLVLARAAGATCIDDCAAEFGGSGEDYAQCVADCGVCGNGVLEGDEECDDGNTVGGDCCDATCHAEAEGSPCLADDDEPCDTGVCDGEGECDGEEAPAPDCRLPTIAGGSTIVLRDAENDAKDDLVWKWRHGDTTSKDEFGDPLDTTTYTLCLYAGDNLVSEIGAQTGGSCGHRGCWAERARGFRYRDPTHTPDGASQILLQHGRRRHAKIVFVAGGTNLDTPAPAELESPLTVQLRRSGSRVCWGASFDFAAGKHEGGRFRDRSAAPPAATTTTTAAPPTTGASSSTSTSTTTPAPGATTSTTLLGATVTVVVDDSTGMPVEDAEVTITYAGGQSTVSDITDADGSVVFDAQPVGVAATVTADDDNGLTGEVATPGFPAGTSSVTVTVR